MSFHMLPRSSVHVLSWASLLVLLCVYLYVHVFPRASVHVTLNESVLAVAVMCVFILFYPTHSCEVTLAVALRQLISTSRVLSGIPFIIDQNLRNVSPCSGLVKEYANIYPVGHYFSENSPFSIKYLINKYGTQMWFFPLCAGIFPILFHEHSTHVILVKIDFLHCIFLSLNKLSQPQALWQGIVCSHYIGFRWYPPFFPPRNIYIVYPDPMDIIAPVGPL